VNKVLITGAAGFIGYHLCSKLMKNGYKVMGLDNLNDYYDVKLKEVRLEQLYEKCRLFEFHKVDLGDTAKILSLFQKAKPSIVVNLAAQAGVRYSLENPYAYINSNVAGFLNILEGCRHNQVKHLIYASSSSVYGGNTKMPFSVHDNVDHPVSLYAATKKANELMAHSYSHLYGIPTTGLRFFTVYGPWGRPDMALFLFTKAILEDKPIKVFNHGKMRRDFTYIDDIVEAIARLINCIPAGNPEWSGDAPDPATSFAPYRLYNIGNNSPVELMYLIEVLEDCLGKKAIKEYLPMQAGDVPATYADVDDLVHDVEFKPNTSIEVGIERFVRWYRSFYKD
jgi:UDP-glucuronate 4-epimerase